MTSQKQQLNEQKMINHLSTVGILGNVILTAFKLLAGIIGHSGAMISDAVHHYRMCLPHSLHFSG